MSVSLFVWMTRQDTRRGIPRERPPSQQATALSCPVLDTHDSEAGTRPCNARVHSQAGYVQG